MSPSNAIDIPDRAALEQQGMAVRACLARNPRVYRVPVDGAELRSVNEFLTANECTQLRAMIDRLAQPSSTYDQAQASTYRSSYSGNFDPHDPLVHAIEQRIDALLGIDWRFGETMQGQRYAPGQQFVGHFDWFVADAPYWPAEIVRGGQRSWTAMIYLNDVEAGGVTEFPRLGVTVAPLEGFLLCWNNARPDGSPNELTLHAARPVERRTKYVVTKWYRTRPWG